MKVTNVINQYIEAEVNAKYQPAIGELEKKQYDITQSFLNDLGVEADKYAEKIKKLQMEFQGKAKEIAKQHGYEFFEGKEYDFVSIEKYGGDKLGASDMFRAYGINSHYVESLTNVEYEILKERIGKLYNQCESKSRQIVLDLELGGKNKTAIKELLDNIEVEEV